MDNITIRNISVEEFNNIKDEIKKEYTSNEENEIPNFVDFTYFMPETIGIYFDEELVGLSRAKDFIKGKTFETYLFPQYRTEDTKELVSELLLRDYGLRYPECETFYTNLFPEEPDKQVFENTGWFRTHEFDEAMMYEGAHMFIVYSKPNPYYIVEKPPRKLEKVPEA